MIIYVARPNASILILNTFRINIIIMAQRYAVKFQSQRFDTLPPDILIKGSWVSTAMALILTLPSLGLFIGLSQIAGVNIGISAGIGFGMHFALLAFSNRISKMISSLFED
jgi:hypothetical protein